MSESAPKQRPQFRNVNVGQIITYRLPPSAKLSIMHRISGALLFLALPVLLLPILSLSLGSQESFDSVRAFVSHPLCKLVLLVLIWAYMHHFCAGIRYLALDLGKGSDKETSQKTAVSVIVIALLLTLVFGLKLFGVW